MAVTLTADLDALATKDAFARLAEAGQDLLPLMEQIGALLEASTRDRLRETNESPDGVPWPKSLRAQEDGGKTLVDTTRLESSITYLAAPAQVEVGTNVLYAGVHQTGMTIVPKAANKLAFTLANGQTVIVDSVTIPARPYLGISGEDAEDIGYATTRYLQAALS